MRAPQGADRVQEFVEAVGAFFEEGGLPRMAGRIFGYLLISVPPEQSLEAIAQALSTSKASISTNTRLLIQIGMLERLKRPGDRKVYYRIRPGSFYTAVKAQLERITRFRLLSEEGLELLADQPPELRARLMELREMYAFFERELPAVLARWEATHKEKQP
ncbi:GbsR/MarR family transcriptional regulator [Marinithermus hydrothermalis]|uniref:Regulatory protein MarR n=1 Tax=Marinithermus hydrothermalis (strain DSM 14884 / JCM 11576 / T1) TaxID=869210 RepID=F2NP57_MARHT|nr:MarR family transcriptional regulator [Marinithermus hydrothermalis]AEB11858.1 regulatory protein MarR [Marinithermus hydrothermalis DSM 14884]